MTRRIASGATYIKLKFWKGALKKDTELKKEAEFLEASFRAKVASIQQGDDSGSRTSIAEQPQYSREEVGERFVSITDGSSSSRGSWSSLISRSNKSSGLSLSTADDSFSKGIDADIVVLMAARASRTENQDAIDAAIVGMLVDPNKTHAVIRKYTSFCSSLPTCEQQFTYINGKGKWYGVRKLAHNKVDIERRVHGVTDKFAE